MDVNTKTGILAGGNWIIDQVKVVDTYPEEEKLSNILNESTGNGGAPFNVLTALYKLNPPFPLAGVGLIGDDDKADSIMQECRQMGINTKQMSRRAGINTSYTDVMTAKATGKRTFFHSRGANALLDESHFDFSRASARIFHLGYLLLLDRLDEIGPDGLTGAATVLKKAKNAGLTTSADIVSEQSDRYKDVVVSSLPYIDILFLNEYEAEMLTDIKIDNNERNFNIEQACQAAEIILDWGVLEWVIIHAPQGVIALNKKQEYLFQSAVKVPPDKIKGSVGAGDALSAGVLYGTHEGWAMSKSLKLGVSVAAASVMAVTATGSIKSLDECMLLGNKYGYRNKVS